MVQVQRWAWMALNVGVLVAVGAACGGSGSPEVGGAATTSAAGTSPVAVVASTNVWGDVVKQVGGDHVSVTSFISSPDQDPHSYESNTRNQLTVSAARVVVENGGGYDDFMGKLIEGSGSKAVVLDAVKVSGKRAPAGGTVNEHVWYDFPTVQKMAAAIAAALGQADPSHAGAYATSSDTFVAKVQALVTREHVAKAKHAGESVAVTEPVPLWLLEAEGLVDVTPPAFSGAVEAGGDVAPRVLLNTLDLFSGKKVRALFFNEQVSGPITEQVKTAAIKAGIPVVGVTETLPDGKGYLSWMSANLDAVDAALGTS